MTTSSCNLFDLQVFEILDLLFTWIMSEHVDCRFSRWGAYLEDEFQEGMVDLAGMFNSTLHFKSKSSKSKYDLIT